ncbi:hypothetical protein ISS05_01655 [Candidatus Woesearchaeota archaeon]|nr:hypothetical protein [Candidatus Woesearchaeota archaeon]
MEKFQELREIAKKKLQLADHILTMTYPIVNDGRLLLAVMENIFLALTNAMGSVLYYERLFKRVPPFHDNFSSKFNLFKEYAEKKKVNEEYLKLIQNTKSIIVKHKTSPVEFARKDQFVICNGSYKTHTISVNELKDYIAKAKSFLRQTQDIVSENENLFAR